MKECWKFYDFHTSEKIEEKMGKWITFFHKTCINHRLIHRKHIGDSK